MAGPTASTPTRWPACRSWTRTVSYYDEHFMQRRMDYSPDVTGNPPVAHYTHDPRRFDGFVFPTRRLVHGHDPTGNADQGFAAITIDIHKVTVR